MLSKKLHIILSYLGLGLLALLPRVLDLGAWISGDEVNFWLRRSDLFLRAIRGGDFAATAISTHPGVTTMWLGAAGLTLADRLIDTGWVRDYSFGAYLGLVRLPIVLVHTLGVLLGYALLRRLFTPLLALLAAVLWASDPFVVAFSRTLHVDALPATFLTLSMLAALVATRPAAAGDRWTLVAGHRWLILSGVGGGLALLSKSPALAILPVIGALLLWQAIWAPVEVSQGTRWRAAVSALLVWGVACLLTVVALWPALWVGPQAAIDQIRLGVEAEGAEPHMLGNFFLGQQDDAPGALFYPVALALRTTPWSLLGLLLLPLIALLTAYRPPSSALRLSLPDRRVLATLALFALVFVAAMTLFPKKFNRYLVPIFPMIDILAAYGLWWLGQVADHMVQRLVGTPQHTRPLSNAKVLFFCSFVPLFSVQRFCGASIWKRFTINRFLVLLLTLLASANLAYYHPYSIVVFNQALGGPAAGVRAFTTGWGEGLSEAAAWLNQQADIRGVLTATTLTAPLQPYMLRGARALRPEDGQLPAAAGYVVVYLRNVQWGPIDPPFDQFYQRAVPLHTVTIHGIEYAWIYQAPPPVSNPRVANFGPAITLRGYRQIAPPGRGTPLQMQLAWQVQATPAANYTLFAHLLAPDGKRVAQVDIPYPTSTWQAGRYLTTEVPLGLPADLPAGSYQLVIGLYEPQTGARLPLGGTPPADATLAGPDALSLLTLAIK